MKHIATLTLALLLGATACNKGVDLDKISKLKDEACACKDKACADDVNKRIDAAVDEMGKGKEPDEATAKKLMEIMTEAGVCLAKHQK
jgi:hypothetical protein